MTALIRELQRTLGVADDGVYGPATHSAAMKRLGTPPQRETLSIATPGPPAPESGSAGRKTSPKGIALIHSFEQCRLTAYPDPGSSNGEPWTIGWGSTGPDIKRGTVWTQEQADARFAADLAKFERGVAAAVGDAPTTQDQFDALVSLFYNIGIGAGTGSTVIRRHKAGDYEGAAAAFGMWVKNDGKVMRGLVRRRAAEAELYRGQA